MTVAIPLLNGVPPESEYLRCAPSWRVAQLFLRKSSIPCGSVCLSFAFNDKANVRHWQVCHRYGRRLCGEDGDRVEHILSCIVGLPVP